MSSARAGATNHAAGAAPTSVFSATDKDFFAWHDAQAMARLEDTEYSVTTPNMDHVPRPHVGLVSVSVCDDFRYGVHDPIQWPQTVTPGWEHLPWVRRREHAPLPWWVLWWSPRKEVDFKPLEGCLFKSLGLLSSSSLAPLRQLAKELQALIAAYLVDHDPHPTLRRHELEMQRALERLIHFPSTFRDACIQLRHLQRSWLMAHAFVDYGNAATTESVDVNIVYMGGITTNPDVAQKLYSSGIPVWFVRLTSAISATKTFIATEVTVRDPDPAKIVTHPFSGLPPIYRGLTGPRYLAAVTRSALGYMDLSHSPLLVRYDAESNRAQDTPADSSSSTGRASQSGAQRTSKSKVKPSPLGSIHRSHLRGRDKFEEFVHDWMPAALPAWRQAMRSVDRSQPAKPASEVWGYWVPEPALLVGSQQTERVVRYFTNWLRVREPWLYLIRTPENGATKVPVQWWRDFLNGDGQTGAFPQNPVAQAGTRRDKRLASVRSVFGKLFDMTDYTPDERAYLHWHGHHFRVLDESLCPLMLWELFELGFRYELLALDRVLVPPNPDVDQEPSRLQLLSHVFARYDLERLFEIPDVPDGLCAEIVRTRVGTTEAFRRVLVRWPLCPPRISSSTPLTTATSVEDVEEIEQLMFSFYVQTFFEYSGRAPLVPHALPARV